MKSSSLQTSEDGRVRMVLEKDEDVGDYVKKKKKDKRKRNRKQKAKKYRAQQLEIAGMTKGFIGNTYQDVETDEDDVKLERKPQVPKRRRKKRISSESGPYEEIEKANDDLVKSVTVKRVVVAPPPKPKRAIEVTIKAGLTTSESEESAGENEVLEAIDVALEALDCQSVSSSGKTIQKLEKDLNTEESASSSEEEAPTKTEELEPHQIVESFSSSEEEPGEAKKDAKQGENYEHPKETKSLPVPKAEPIYAVPKKKYASVSDAETAKAISVLQASHAEVISQLVHDRFASSNHLNSWQKPKRGPRGPITSMRITDSRLVMSEPEYVFKKDLDSSEDDNERSLDDIDGIKLKRARATTSLNKVLGKKDKKAEAIYANSLDMESIPLEEEVKDEVKDESLDLEPTPKDKKEDLKEIAKLVQEDEMDAEQKALAVSMVAPRKDSLDLVAMRRKKKKKEDMTEEERKERRERKRKKKEKKRKKELETQNEAINEEIAADYQDITSAYYIMKRLNSDELVTEI